MIASSQHALIKHLLIEKPASLHKRQQNMSGASYARVVTSPCFLLPFFFVQEAVITLAFSICDRRKLSFFHICGRKRLVSLRPSVLETTEGANHKHNNFRRENGKKGQMDCVNMLLDKQNKGTIFFNVQYVEPRYNKSRSQGLAKYVCYKKVSLLLSIHVTMTRQRNIVRYCGEDFFTHQVRYRHFTVDICFALMA